MLASQQGKKRSPNSHAASREEPSVRGRFIRGQVLHIPEQCSGDVVLSQQMLLLATPGNERLWDAG